MNRNNSKGFLDIPGGIIIVFGLILLVVGFLSQNKNLPSSAAPTLAFPQNFEANTVQQAPESLYVKTEQMKLRAGPGTTFQEVGRVRYGDMVTAVGKIASTDGGNWVKVRAGNLEGWLNKKFLSSTQQSDDQDCDECSGVKIHEEPLQKEGAKDQIESNMVTLGSTYVTESFALAKPEAKTVVERKVIAKDNEKITVAATNINNQSQKPRILEFTKDWNLLSSRNTSGSGSNFAPAVKYFDFPLYPGKKWQEMATETIIKTGAVKQHTLSATVGDWETISVPAGTFKGIKIIIETEVIDSVTGEKTTGTDTSWYVPEVGRSVKSITSSRNAEGKEQQQIIQLISYKIMLENQA